MPEYLTVQNEDGSTSKILVVSVREHAKPIYDYFGLEIGDKALLDHAANYLNEIVEKREKDLLLSTLWQDKINFIDLWEAISCIPAEEKKLYIATPSQSYHIDVPTSYEKWIKAYGDLFLVIAQETKEGDHEIQRLLIGEQLISELSRTQYGNRVIAELYDCRGIDFFLQYYFCGEVSAYTDTSLFDLAQLYIIRALESLNREEEVSIITQEIEQRKEGLLQIQQEYTSPSKRPEEFNLEKVRLQGERFWYGYLSGEVWKLLDTRSKDDLLDAFITEVLIRKQVLRGWCPIALSLCKVIEREMALSLFIPWTTEINQASFSAPISSSRSKEKRIQQRKFTFEIMKKYAHNKDKPPTLGQLVFIAQYWNDPIMDECTSLMKQIRTITESLHKEYSKNITELCQALQESVESINIIDLRNASAHPGKEQNIDWDKHVKWLKKAMGKPPKRILKLLTMFLRPDVLKVKHLIIS